MKRIAYASIAQETHGFNPINTTYDSFESEMMLREEKIMEDIIMTEGEANFFTEIFGDREEYELVPLLVTVAVPSGPMVENDYQRLRREFFALFSKHLPYDGIFLSLHGAMSSEGTPDVEGDILAEIRKLIGNSIPICVSLDHHANITKNMVELSNNSVRRSTDGVIFFSTFPTS